MCLVENSARIIPNFFPFSLKLVFPIMPFQARKAYPPFQHQTLKYLFPARHMQFPSNSTGTFTELKRGAVNLDSAERGAIAVVTLNTMSISLTLSGVATGVGTFTVDLPSEFKNSPHIWGAVCVYGKTSAVRLISVVPADTTIVRSTPITPETEINGAHFSLVAVAGWARSYLFCRGGNNNCGNQLHPDGAVSGILSDAAIVAYASETFSRNSVEQGFYIREVIDLISHTQIHLNVLFYVVRLHF